MDLIMKADQVSSYSAQHLTGVKREGVRALQGSAKQLRLTDRANIRGQKWESVGERMVGGSGGRRFGAMPSAFGKSPHVWHGGKWQAGY